MVIDENRWQSMKLKVTKFSVIDWSSISNINRLIGIDYYRLVSIIIDYRFHRLVRSGDVVQCTNLPIRAISLSNPSICHYFRSTQDPHCLKTLGGICFLHRKFSWITILIAKFSESEWEMSLQKLRLKCQWVASFICLCLSIIPESLDWRTKRRLTFDW